ncbi:hypothetical protein [Streptococcus henryi]|uniref:type II toxin-antitoxin system RelB/ParD family antitoxin n=1 Tax=Streptococcus henryi TaxID=439219 RepID=UPI000368B74A|nr:hypothetical protein [Streptococcus henryi]
MDIVEKKVQVSFKTDSELLKEAKKVIADNNLDMTKAYNLFLENIVARQEIPLLTEEELRKEKIFKSLQQDVAESIAEYHAGKTKTLDEVREKYGLGNL